MLIIRTSNMKLKNKIRLCQIIAALNLFSAFFLFTVSAGQHTFTMQLLGAFNSLQFLFFLFAALGFESDLKKEIGS